MKKSMGFTLIELMIAIAVVGVLVAIAYPSYQNTLLKGNRASAKAFLIEVAQRQQQYLLDARTYASKDQLVATGVTLPKEVEDFYTWTVTANPGPPPTFDSTLTPIATKRAKNDGWWKIDNTGAKTSEKNGGW